MGQSEGDNTIAWSASLCRCQSVDIGSGGGGGGGGGDGGSYGAKEGRGAGVCLEQVSCNVSKLA